MDTILIELIQYSDESAYGQDVDVALEHSEQEVNTLKTVGMTVDFRRRIYCKLYIPCILSVNDR